MPFSKDFLTELADEKGLTEQQIAVFVLLFGEEDKNRVQIANELKTTETVISSRLTEIYKKFEINDPGPVKERELRRYLEDRQKRKPVISSLDALVEEVRSRLQPFITGNIGTMKMLSVNLSVPVDKIYIDLNVFEQLSCSHFSSLRQEFDPNNREEFDRLGLSRVKKERKAAIPVVKEHRKLMVVGKPGAGKTTFLKSLAVACIQSEKELFAELVPLFVTLREFAKEARRKQSWKLLDYLTWLLADHWKGCDRASAEKILTHGRSLVLLDGLDEVPPEDLENAIDAVKEFGHTSNRLVITCRTQSQQELDGFTDVEVADFQPEQVDRFVENWFKIVDSGSQASLAPQLQQQLRVTENNPIAELTITPVLLNLICAVFRDEQGNLPKNRFQLYTKGMRQLLERLKRRTPIDERLTIDAKEKFLA